MKNYLLSIIAILTIYQSHAQVENSKEVIVKNKVKSVVEKHCFYGSNSSCTVFYRSYDQRGNLIKWNMGRLGTRYEYLYDKQNNKIATIWINKSDTTKVDTIRFEYYKNGKLIAENNIPYPNDSQTIKNTYDNKNRLIRQVATSKNYENDSIVTNCMLAWTNFDKIKSEYIFGYKLGNAKDTLFTSKKMYTYDPRKNLRKEIHYSDNEVVNVIEYAYDASSRLIKEREYNERRIASLNKHKYGSRKDIKALLTTFSYDGKGRIKEKYTYFSDPCMSLDNHFMFTHYYTSNDLLEKVDVTEEGKPRFTISFEYTFY